MCGDHLPYPTYAQRTESVAHPLLPKITNTRIDRFFWGPYASQHLDKTLARARYAGAPHVKLTLWAAPNGGKPSFDEAVRYFDGSQEVIEVGHTFGLSWTNHWVKAELTIPEEVQRGDGQVIFEFDPSCEAMVYTPEGVPLHAITGGPNTMKDGSPGEQEDRRVEHIIPADAVRSGSYTCFIEVTCNGMFGLGPYRYLHPDPDRTFPLVAADIVLPNPHARGLRTDFRILAEISRHPSAQTTGLAQRCLKACDDIMNAFRRTEKQTADELDAMLLKCRGIGWKILGDLDENQVKTLAVWNDDREREADIWAIGHCHIDTAWLWRYTQTQQKIARSWTSQCDLMDRYPGHQFAASSAQQYEWLEQLYPSAFERVSMYVKGGRFHPVGGAWLEHDCMMPSGESLCRHYLYGQRYFREKFGSYCREAFLPDTFGYASQLPQILRSAGLQYFFTQKISWNNINVFPYNTFNWAGIDGTQVLAHMTPVDGYNGQCTFTEIIKGIQNNKNLGTTDKALFLFGNGDGGGGPTPAMMERLERLDSLGRNNPGVPTIKVGSPIDFFDELCRKTDGGATLPTWRGELYLELHRGTYTTQACIKRGNRDMETLFRDVEFFATMASLRTKFQYPTDEIRECWQEMMLGQFHDCLPGTTIKAVVEDNLEIYARRSRQVDAILHSAIGALETGQSLPADQPFVIDPMRLAREELHESTSTPGQFSWLTTDDSGMGSLVPPPSTLSLPQVVFEDTKQTFNLSNDRYSITLSQTRIVSIYDKLNAREIIAPGVGTQTAGLMLYEDYPLTYDAWDAEIYHLQMGQEIHFDKVQIKDQGVRKSLVASAKFGRSTANIIISLDATSTNTVASTPIHVRAEIDWHEEHRFLKFALPLDVHSAYATYGTQFGVVERPTHRNTTIDQAKFEVCAHGFADLSEAGYGVAIACRDKYGYAVEGNTMRLSLVRAPKSPDPDADQGHHSIDFAIMPHVKHISDSDIHKRALRYNSRVYVLPRRLDMPTFTVSGDTSEGIILETIKRGEDDTRNGKKTILCRIHEAKGGRARGVLKIRHIAINGADFVNILEDDLDTDARHCKTESAIDGIDIHLDFRAFELATLCLRVED